MGEITRDQFIRGIEAINAHRQAVDAAEKVLAAISSGEARLCVGDSLLTELTRQLAERCNDEPEPVSGTMIEYMLYECGGPVTLEDGRQFMVNTPELLWNYWEQSETGPFDTTPPEQSAAGHPVAVDGGAQAPQRSETERSTNNPAAINRSGEP